MNKLDLKLGTRVPIDSAEFMCATYVERRLLVIVNRILNGRAHICGGALRSVAEGNLPKDIDIFMLTDSIEEYTNVCRDIQLLLGLRRQNGVPIDDTEYFSCDFIYDYLYFTEEPVYQQVVISVIKPQVLYGRHCWGTLEELVDGIDLSVCRLGLRANGTIYAPDIDTTKTHIENKVMSVVKQRGEEESARTKKRLKKYEGYGYTLIP